MPKTAARSAFKCPPNLILVIIAKVYAIILTSKLWCSKSSLSKFCKSDHLYTYLNLEIKLKKELFGGKLLS